MPTRKKHVEFAICIANSGYDDLDVWRVYQVLPDAKAAGVGCIRVIDESGEDYLYPADRFAAVDFPEIARSRLPKWQPRSGAKALQSSAKKRRPLSA
jgi:hypothetical protein